MIFLNSSQVELIHKGIDDDVQHSGFIMFVICSHIKRVYIFYFTKYICHSKHIFVLPNTSRNIAFANLRPILLTWFNFYPSMDQ